MGPIEKLMDEHKNILTGLDILQRNADLLEEGKKIDPGFFTKIIDFIRNYADKYHHAKEENILFVKLGKAGFPAEGGPVGVMLEEHDQGRKYVALMEKANQHYIDGNQSATKDVVENAKGFIYLLRQHIDKENNILYPMAKDILGESGIEAMIPEFDNVEKEQAGTEKKYISLLKELNSNWPSATN